MWAVLLQNQIISQYSFSLLTIIAFLFGSFAFWKKAREDHYDEYEIIDLILLTLLWSLIGARIVYIVLFFDQFGLSILHWLAFITKPGFHWIGLYLGATISIIQYCFKKGWNVFKTLDLAVIGLAFSQALIHLGIFLSGGGAGKVTDLFVGVNFPNTFQPRHPVSLYGFFLWLIVFGILWWLESKYRRFTWYQRNKGDSLPGFLLFSYLIALGLIGAMLIFVSEPATVYYGVDLDLFVRICIVLFGTFNLIARSGWGSKLGLDQVWWLAKK